MAFLLKQAYPITSQKPIEEYLTPNTFSKKEGNNKSTCEETHDLSNAQALIQHLKQIFKA